MGLGMVAVAGWDGIGHGCCSRLGWGVVVVEGWDWVAWLP